MTHGYMSNCTTFGPLLGKLAVHYDLVLFDNCCWGLNTRLTESKAWESNPDAIAWLKEFIFKTIEGMDLPETFLFCCHSFGAFLAMTYSVMKPERVESMFAISPVGCESFDPTDY